ncbi:MAG: radical SAM protein, partial [Pseudomonadota bacterium]|nr:radical SAM protein [Pseudomonadota bacterium]
MAHIRTIRDVAGLVEAGLVDETARVALEKVGARYAVAVPPAFQALIEHADDPIAQQVVPHADELVMAGHEQADPIGDERFSPMKGIVHRYPDRVLLKPLLACPIYCRFCFRREQVGPDGGTLTEAELAAAYAWVRDRPDIREVILTGGDPLMLSPRRLGDILAELSAIPHVELLRVHTRVPVAMPERMTAELAEALAREAPIWVVVHANHARELSPAARTGL